MDSGLVVACESVLYAKDCGTVWQVVNLLLVL